MAQILPPSRDFIITIEYDATGFATATLRDFPILGWLVEKETDAAAPPGRPPLPLPVIIGGLPPPAPDTGPVISPQWCALDLDVAGTNCRPDGTRHGHISDFFTWLATNGGADRKLPA